MPVFTKSKSAITFAPDVCRTFQYHHSETNLEAMRKQAEHIVIAYKTITLTYIYIYIYIYIYTLAIHKATSEHIQRTQKEAGKTHREIRAAIT